MHFCTFILTNKLLLLLQTTLSSFKLDKSKILVENRTNNNNNNNNNMNKNI